MAVCPTVRGQSFKCTLYTMVESQCTRAFINDRSPKAERTLTRARVQGLKDSGYVAWVDCYGLESPCPLCFSKENGQFAEFGNPETGKTKILKIRTRKVLTIQKKIFTNKINK